MGKLTKKDKRRTLFWSLLILVIISYLAVFTINYYIGNNSKTEEYIKLEEEYNKLLEEEEKLNSEVTKLQDPEYVAKYAREKYLLSGDNEIILNMDED